MEERLIQIGNWLRVNGEAIYGTRPWKQSRQWSAGEVPKVDYSQDFNSNYDVSKLVAKPAPGRASIEAFFTSRGNEVYAILPRWPGRAFTIRQFDASKLKSVALVGSSAPVKWKAQGGSVALDLPEVPEDLMRQPAWVLKLSR